MTVNGYLAIYVFLGKSSIYVFNSKQYISQFISLDFHIIPGGLSPRWVFLISPVESLLLGFTQEKFWNFGIFPGESSSPHQGIETGCINKFIIYIWNLTPLPTRYQFKLRRGKWWESWTRPNDRKKPAGRSKTTWLSVTVNHVNSRSEVRVSSYTILTYGKTQNNK